MTGSEFLEDVLSELGVTAISSEGLTQEDAEFYKRTDTKENAKWAHSSWTVQLKLNGRELVTPFRMGRGHTGSPEAAGVVASLAVDAQSAEECSTFEEWCDSMGYDSDSRRMELIYARLKQEAKNLREWLGEHYERVVQAACEY